MASSASSSYTLPFAAALVLLLPLAAASSQGLHAQGGAGERSVTVYVSHDQEHSESILEAFTAKTGIEVKPNFDTEDNKTVGLVNKIIAERENPVADVFWNNECGQTERLRREGLLQPYASPAAEAYDPKWRAEDRTWHGFAARSRVLIWNAKLVDEADLPNSLHELADARYQGRVGMAKPLTGTTMTQAGALMASTDSQWGVDKAFDWYDRMKRNGTRWERGNAQVAQQVAEGAYPMGMTDTDDVNVRRAMGEHVRQKLLGQGPDGLGCLVIPNSVMILQGAKNLPEAQALVDFLLSPEVELMLAEGRAVQIPLQKMPADTQLPAAVVDLSDKKTFAVDFAQVGVMLAEHSGRLEESFDGVGEADSNLVSLIVLAAVLLGAVAFVVIRNRKQDGED